MFKTNRKAKFQTLNGFVTVIIVGPTRKTNNRVDGYFVRFPGETRAFFALTSRLK